MSTVRDADAIAVVKQGSVIELGTHSELLAKGGAYATLVQMQQAAGDEEDIGHVDDSRPIFGRRSTSLDIEKPKTALDAVQDLDIEAAVADAGKSVPTVGVSCCNVGLYFKFVDVTFFWLLPHVDPSIQRNCVRI